MLGIIMYDTHTSVLSTTALKARIRYVRCNVTYSTLLNKLTEIRGLGSDVELWTPITKIFVLKYKWFGYFKRRFLHVTLATYIFS